LYSEDIMLSTFSGCSVVVSRRDVVHKYNDGGENNLEEITLEQLLAD